MNFSSKVCLQVISVHLASSNLFGFDAWIQLQSCVISEFEILCQTSPMTMFQQVWLLKHFENVCRIISSKFPLADHVTIDVSQSVSQVLFSNKTLNLTY